MYLTKKHTTSLHFYSGKLETCLTILILVYVNTYAVQLQKTDQGHSPSKAALALDVQHLVDQSEWLGACGLAVDNKELLPRMIKFSLHQHLQVSNNEQQTAIRLKQLSILTAITHAHAHIHPVLQQLHWLPISFCIDYKIATLAYKVLNTGCPDYLRQSVHFYTPSWHLCSTNQMLLSKPTTRTVISSRAFSRAASTIWNSLPHDIRVADSFGRLRQPLRTHLYSLVFH